MKNKGLVVVLSIICAFVGIIGGFCVTWYFSLKSDALDIDVEAYVSESSNSQTQAVTASGIQEAKAGAVAVHFLELGNKYTGDCTYIKVGTNIDILIDCGSKSSSVDIVTNYLNQYVTDGTLEYVIITHAHQDHYAGFATPANVNSIFDNFVCENIISFAKTNQKSKTKASENAILNRISSEKAGKNSTQTMYDFFVREVSDEVNNGAHFYTATEFRDANANGIVALDSINNINMQILDSYYYTNKAETENDYSVCMQLTQGDKKFLFTGDLEKDGEDRLVALNDAYMGQVEVYKAGHHGSKTSSNEILLAKIQPKIVCVCCCAGSKEYTKNVSNQFPTVDFIKRISPYTTQVFVTTLCLDYDKNEFTSFNGNIVVMSENATSAVAVCCSNNNTILKDSAWYKQNRLELCRTAGVGQTWLS